MEAPLELLEEKGHLEAEMWHVEVIASWARYSQASRVLSQAPSMASRPPMPHCSRCKARAALGPQAALERTTLMAQLQHMGADSDGMARSYRRSLVPLRLELQGAPVKLMKQLPALHCLQLRCEARPVYSEACGVRSRSWRWL